ncbi:MAG: hypothetical protein AAF809_01070 [Bacteroidota bacterium]
MGQQQLLLLVLGIVIVGLAVVSGIEAFEDNDRRNALDNMAASAHRVVTDMIAWRAKPGALGGGQEASASAPFNNVQLSALGYNVQEQPTGLGTQRGEWADLGGGMWARLGSQASSRPSVTVRNTRQPTIVVEVFLWGPDPNCMVARYGEVSGRTWTYTIPSSALTQPTGCDGW